MATTSSKPNDIFTEPKRVDPNTLRNLDPLRKTAGVWEGRKGKDVNPKAKGPERNDYVERYSLQPIDPQLNGPQLLYGFRYFTFITEPDKTEMYHEQVGYWLWEPATQTSEILIGAVSTRKYVRVVHRSAALVGISKSALSREFVKASAQALAQLQQRNWSGTELIAIYVDGIIFAGHHIIAAVGLAATGQKHLLGLASGASENARVVKDLLSALAQRGVDMNTPRLWIIDGSKALASAITEMCGQDARIQRCRVHKIRNVSERISGNKTLAAQVRWQMQAAFKLDAHKAQAKLKLLAKQLSPRYKDAAASCLEGLEQMFTVNTLGVTGDLLKSLSSTNVIESPNSVVRSVCTRVKHYKDAEMALRWTAVGFLEAEKKFRRVRGYKQLPDLLKALRPAHSAKALKKAA
jgi:putative transposase